MVMTIRNTCRMFDNLFQFVRNREMKHLLCPIRVPHKYLSQMEQYRPGIEGLFIATGMLKKRVSRSTISEEDCRSLKVRAHEVGKVATALLFKRNCTVHQVLKVGTW